MNANKKNGVALIVLVLESIFLTAFILAIDKDVNGIYNAFSLKYTVDFAVFGTLFLFLLATLYITLLRKGIATTAAWLIICGLIFSWILSMIARGSDNDRLYFFVLTALVISSMLALSVGAAFFAGKLAGQSYSK
jgi:hypothetical protein